MTVLSLSKIYFSVLCTWLVLFYLGICTFGSSSSISSAEDVFGEPFWKSLLPLIWFYRKFDKLADSLSPKSPTKSILISASSSSNSTICLVVSPGWLPRADNYGVNYNDSKVMKTFVQCWRFVSISLMLDKVWRFSSWPAFYLPGDSKVHSVSFTSSSGSFRKLPMLLKQLVLVAWLGFWSYRTFCCTLCFSSRKAENKLDDFFADD